MSSHIYGDITRNYNRGNEYSKEAHNEADGKDEKPETQPAKEKPRDSLFENDAGPIGYGKD